jgi:hypothetical protein
MKKLWIFFSLVFLCPTVPSVAEDGKKAEEQTFQVPYRLTNTQHVLVRAKINDKGPFNFIIDTGAPALFVATAVAQKLGVEPDKDLWGTFDRIEIEGGVVIAKVKSRIETPFQLEGMNGLGLAGAELHGIIGYNLLAKFRLEFDFTKDKMTWTRLNYEPPSPQGLGGKGSAADGLDALGSIMKFMGAMMGKKTEPPMKFRGFLGLELADVDGGVEIKAVLVNSPADKAGFKIGDRISHCQDKAVASQAALGRLMSAVASGQTARLIITRDSKAQEIAVKLGEGL